MKVRDINGNEVASAAISGNAGVIVVNLSMAGITVPLRVSLATQGDGLIAKGEIAPLGAAIDIEVEPSDISGLMAGMNRDVMQFALKAMMKKK